MPACRPSHGPAVGASSLSGHETGLLGSRVRWLAGHQPQVSGRVFKDPGPIPWTTPGSLRHMSSIPACFPSTVPPIAAIARVFRVISTQARSRSTPSGGRSCHGIADRQNAISTAESAELTAKVEVTICTADSHSLLVLAARTPTMKGTVSNAALMLIRETETTVAMICNAILHLLTNDDPLAPVRANPSLTPTAIKPIDLTFSELTPDDTSDLPEAEFLHRHGLGSSGGAHQRRNHPHPATRPPVAQTGRARWSVLSQTTGGPNWVGRQPVTSWPCTGGRRRDRAQL